MATEERIDIPLLSQILTDGVRPGTIFVVEFDPVSQWFAVAVSIVARWVKSGRRAGWVAMARPREEIRSDLARLGLNVLESERANLLLVDDWHSATLGLESSRDSQERVQGEGGPYNRINSLKVSDWSVHFLKMAKEGLRDVGDDWPPGGLTLADSLSPALRFNEEKPYLEWIENRVNPSQRSQRGITFQGVLSGLHSSSFYTRIENAADGVLDVRVMEREEQAKNYLRIRGLKGQRHDARWHQIEIRANGEAILTD